MIPIAVPLILGYKELLSPNITGKPKAKPKPNNTKPTNTQLKPDIQPRMIAPSTKKTMLIWRILGAGIFLNTLPVNIRMRLSPAT